MLYEAHNYAMGRKVQSINFEAISDDEAIRIAESRLRGAHALPGTSPQAASKARVIGIKKVTK